MDEEKKVVLKPLWAPGSRPWDYTCSTCNGAGGWSIGNCEDGEWETCWACHGSGEDPE